MTKKLLSLGALLVGALVARAEEAKPPFSITTDVTFVSDYIFRGIKQQENAFQPSVLLTSGTVSLGLWTSQATSKRDLSVAQGSEIDLFGSYGIPVGDYTVSLGGTCYYYPSARPSFGEPGETYEVSAGVSGPVGPFTGSLTYFHDFKLKSNTLQAGLAWSYAFPETKLVLDAGGFFAFNRIDDFNGGLPGQPEADYRYYGLDAQLSYRVTPGSALKAGIHWADTAGLPGNKSHVWFNLGVSTGF